MSHEPALAAPPILHAVRRRVDPVLESFLQEVREELTALHPRAADLVDEIRRLLAAGGKRLRPAFCYLGYRAAGGPDGEPIIRAAAALELFHGFALIHDDLMDESEERRGVPSAYVRFAAEHRARGLPGDPARFGRSAGMLAGDLAAVLADRLLDASGFPPERLLAARRVFDRMRLAMAAGQYLDVGAADGVDASLRERVATLKTGAYTVEGPLEMGAGLAAGAPAVVEALAAYGRPLGIAFQLRDDVVDRGPEAAGPSPERVNELIADAWLALEGALLDPGAVADLRALADALELR